MRRCSGRKLALFAEGTDPDLVFETHSHWAVGQIHGFSVRVFRDGEITDAFRAYHELASKSRSIRSLTNQITATANTTPRCKTSTV